MEYFEFNGKAISRLGMGNMRLPVKGQASPSSIDIAKSEAIIDYVYQNGVNYFDTAWMYHDGQSERFIGEALKKYPRDSFFLADKLWGFLMREGKSVGEVLDEQMSRCQVDYIDFYLLHDLAESTYDIYMDKTYGIVPYLLEQREKGRIRHLGFSSHAKPDLLSRFLDQWDCFEFVQIQLNYLDWTLQDAKRQYEIVTEKGLPVWVMEPCRGGRLASLNPELDATLLEANPGESVASWAFRWLQTLPNVKVTLSGMTTMEQAEENVATFSRSNPLTDGEMAILDQVIEQLKGKINIPCTKCHYCDGCPVGLDIPGLLESYNEFCVEPGQVTQFMGFQVPKEKQPDACVECGACVERCPQHIDIPGALKKFSEGMASHSTVKQG